MKWIDEKRAALRVYLRERKEREEERKAAKQATLPHAAAPALWVWFLAAIAVCTLLGSSWMLAVFIAGSVGHVDWSFDWRAGNDGAPPRWIWSAEANLHALIGVGLALACIGVAMFNAVWLHVREHIRSVLFRRVLTAIGVAVALFMISGAIVTQQWGTDARTRDEVIAAQTAQQGVAAIDAEITALEHRWQTLCAPNLTTWQAQACRSGEQAWNDRIQIAQTQYRQNDPQLQIIVRAIADAKEGDRMQARLLTLRQQRSQAAVTTVQAEAQDVRATGWFATFARGLEDIRKPFIAVLGELLAMTMFGVALEAHRSRQPYRVPSDQSGWADIGHQIADHSTEAPLPVAPEGLKPPREVVTDAETGEELIRITPKPHWRKTKGKKQRVETTPDIPPDETGVPHDGGGRIASAAAHTIDNADEAHATSEAETGLQPGDRNDREESDQPNDAPTDTQPEPPPEEPTDSDIADYESAGISLIDTEAAAVQPPHEEEQHADSAEPDQESEQDEPPVQPRALLAAAE